jgi:Fe-S cluster assembly protein SufD
VTTAAKDITAGFAKVSPALPGAATTWLSDWRAASLQRFVSLGFPSVREEAWKYTSVAALASRPLKAAAPTVFAQPIRAQSPGAHLLVFVNGRYEASLSRLGSLPESVRVRSIAEVLDQSPETAKTWLQRTDETRAFSALNGAFLQDGVLVEVGPNTRVEEPIEILWLGEWAEGALISERLWVEARAGSELTVVERFEGASGGSYWRNALGEVRLGDNARIRHVVCQLEGPEAFHFRQLKATVGRSARYESHQLAFGSKLGRSEIELKFEGEGGEGLLNGLFVGANEQHLDNRTLIDHAVPHCRSEELYKGILGGRASGVFDGKVLVRREAQKTDAAQTNRNLLLTKDAEINTKPQLEIYADDVKCSHGATTGQLDPSALFYLRARGVGKPEAEKLLTSAFAHEVMDAVPVEGLAAFLDEHWLKKALAWKE